MTRYTAKELQDFVRSNGGCVPGAKLSRTTWPVDSDGKEFENLSDMAKACGLFVSERSGTTTHMNVAISPEALATGPPPKSTTPTAKSSPKDCKHGEACTHMLKPAGCRDFHPQPVIDAARAAAAGGGGPPAAGGPPEPEKINGRIRCRKGAQCKGPCTWGHTTEELKAKKAGAPASTRDPVPTPAPASGGAAHDAELQRLLLENAKLKIENQLYELAQRVSMSASINPAIPRAHGFGGHK